MDIQGVDKPKLINPKELSDFNRECRGLIKELQENVGIRTKVELFEYKELSYWRFHRKALKFSDKANTQQLIKKIDEILEARLVKQGLDGKNFPFVIFLLKNHYGYQDKRETESTNTHVFKVTRGDLKALKANSRVIVPNKIKT